MTSRRHPRAQDTLAARHPSVQLSSTPTFGMPKNPTFSTKTLLGSCRRNLGFGAQRRCGRAVSVRGFPPRTLQFLKTREVFSATSALRNNKNPTWISSDKQGRAGCIHCQQATWPPPPRHAMRPLKGPPPTPFTFCTEHTNVKISSSEALLNSQSLALEAKKKTHPENAWLRGS